MECRDSIPCPKPSVQHLEVAKAEGTCTRNHVQSKVKQICVNVEEEYTLLNMYTKQHNKLMTLFTDGLRTCDTTLCTECSEHTAVIYMYMYLKARQKHRDSHFVYRVRDHAGWPPENPCFRGNMHSIWNPSSRKHTCIYLWSYGGSSKNDQNQITGNCKSSFSEFFILLLLLLLVSVSMPQQT